MNLIPPPASEEADKAARKREKKASGQNGQQESRVQAGDEQPHEGQRPRIRTLPIQPGDVPVRLLFPNMLTLLGLVAGLTAIRMGFEERFDMAVYMILLAAFMDGIDGRAARLLKASTRFGAELDSLADFVNFGVAPAFILYFWGLHGDMKPIGWIVVLIFALCMVLRLARFNVALDAPDEPRWKMNYFVGVPAPAGAFVVLLPVYLHLVGMPYLASLKPLVIAYILLVAFLLVSQVPTFSGKLLGEKISRDHVAPLLLFFGIVVALFLAFPFFVLILGVLIYLAFIPVSIQKYKGFLARDAGFQHDDSRRFLQILGGHENSQKKRKKKSWVHRRRFLKNRFKK